MSRMGKPAKDFAEYVSRQPIAVQQILKSLRAAIKKAFPKSEEKISWGMPTFVAGKNRLHFAAFKNHIGVFPGPQVIQHFKNELADFNTSKGTIQFQYAEKFPLALFKKIAKYALTKTSPAKAKKVIRRKAAPKKKSTQSRASARPKKARGLKSVVSRAKRL